MILICENCGVSKEFENIDKDFSWQCSKCTVKNTYTIEEKKKEYKIHKKPKDLTVVYMFDGRRGIPRRIQFDFIAKLQDLCKLYVYGPKENDKDLSPISYNKKRDAEGVVKELNADVFLLPEHAIVKGIFPTGFNKVSIPSALIEVDYYSIHDKNMYKDKNIDLIIHRGYVDTVCGTPSVWMPNSAAEDFHVDINDNYLDERHNLIGFIGNGYKSRNKLYNIRKRAIDILNKEKLLGLKGNVGYESYPNELKRFVAALSCSCSPLQMAPAKNYEIGASGTVLLTQWFYGSEELFGCKKTFFTYKDDCSNIVDVAKDILSNREEAYRVSRNMLKQIQKHHLDRHRIVELYNILKALVSGNEIPKKWGR